MEANEITLKKERYDPVAHTIEVANSLVPIAKAKDVSLDVVRDPSAPTLLTADPLIAKQIQTHLISNAIKHASKGGHVSITWACDDGSLSVHDDGPGIDHLVLKNFGRPFTGGDAFKATGASKTHGLGLYICKKFVEARGGRLELANLPDHGAKVTAFWPVDTVDAEF